MFEAHSTDRRGSVCVLCVAVRVVRDLHEVWKVVDLRQSAAEEQSPRFEWDKRV